MNREFETAERHAIGSPNRAKKEKKMPIPNDLTSWRNRLAVPLANWVLNHIATPGYRTRIDICIRVGIEQVYGSELQRRLDTEAGRETTKNVERGAF